MGALPQARGAQRPLPWDLKKAKAFSSPKGLELGKRAWVNVEQL